MSPIPCQPVRSHLSPRRAGVLVSLAVLVAAGSAAASPGYPQILYDEVDAGCAPPCTVCHETIRGGWDTATKPFAEALMHQGLVGDDEESLEIALEYLDADSDGDGRSDLDALRAGLDPNDSTEPLCPVESGCVVASVPGHRATAPGLWWLLGLLLGWRRVASGRAPFRKGRRS